MALRIKNTSLLLFLFSGLLIYFLSPGTAEAFSDNEKPSYSLHKDGVQMNSRKLLGNGALLDYDYAGPNPRHDPRKGKPGNGGKNL